MILTLFCGGGWTRTTELIRGQIYSLLQLPLCDSPILIITKLHEPVEGFEPPTPRLQITCSGQLSYTGILSWNFSLSDKALQNYMFYRYIASKI